MSLFLFFLFFFTCYGDHRDLHSFPTRRSSDLISRLVTSSAAVNSVMSSECQASVSIVCPEIGERSALLLDRKSTRLNSSHTVISYAVFCLKKKKKCKNINNHWSRS